MPTFGFSHFVHFSLPFAGNAASKEFIKFIAKAPSRAFNRAAGGANRIRQSRAMTRNEQNRFTRTTSSPSTFHNNYLSFSLTNVNLHDIQERLAWDGLSFGQEQQKKRVGG